MVGLDDYKGLFQPKHFYDSMKQCLNPCPTAAKLNVIHSVDCEVQSCVSMNYIHNIGRMAVVEHIHTD